MCNKEEFYLENLRNQGENLEKFKKPEQWKNGKFKKQAHYWKTPTVPYVPILSVGLAIWRSFFIVK